MAIDIPPHYFAAAPDHLTASLLMTPELKCWACEAITSLDVAGHHVPADLVRLRDGCTVS